MSTFLDTYWDGYKVVIRPHEMIRKRIHYHAGYLPYMDGQQIGLDLKIKAPATITEEDIRCEWHIIKMGSDQEFGTDEFIQHMSPNKECHIRLSSKFLLLQESAAKYILNFKLIRPKKIAQEYKKIAVLSVKDRGDMTMIILPILISVVISVTALILSIVGLIT